MYKKYMEYKTNRGGYYWYRIEPENDFLSCGFEEYTRRCGNVWSTKDGDVDKGLDEIKRIVPDFYKLICEMLQFYGKDIKDYETGVNG